MFAVRILIVAGNVQQVTFLFFQIMTAIVAF